MLELQETNIKNMIYTIRGQQVMLDSDLARLYEIETGALNRAVKRNQNRFPENYCFVLEKNEYENLICQTGISSLSSYGGRRSLPRVFTEQGIAMLSAVLHTDKAIQVSISIINAFVSMRHYLIENKNIITVSEYESLSKRIDENRSFIDSNRKKINQLLDNFIDETKIKEFVFVDGQKFEADEAYINIYKLAKKSIYVVDDYVSIKTLSHLKQVADGVEVTLFTDNKAGRSKMTLTEVNDFIAEYYLIELRETAGLVHDRLIVLDYGLDSEKIYLCGASSKDAGAKFCTILEVHDVSNYHGVIDKLLLNNLLVLY